MHIENVSQKKCGRTQAITHREHTHTHKLTYFLIYLLITYLLYGAESFLRS